MRGQKRQDKNLAKILERQQAQVEGVLLVAGMGKKRAGEQEKRWRPKQMVSTLEENQCAFCKQEGHWAQDCLRKKTRMGKRPTPILATMEENSNYARFPSPSLG